MSSIRKRLLAWLLAGFAVLWLVVGFSVYVTVRNSLKETFDAELKAMASEVRYLVPESRYLQEPTPSPTWIDFFQADSGLYFEVWDADLLFSDRSPSLGDVALPRPTAFSSEPVTWNFTLETGEQVRGVAQQFTLATPVDALEMITNQGGYLVNVVVARNRDALDRSLHLLLAATGLVGLLLIPLCFLIVRISVRQGLQPLGSFGERVASFGIDSLDQRFETRDLPAELLPVAERLNGLMERLEAGLERERRLNADLAHELRTPVAELKTMSEVALSWPDKIGGDQYQEVLNVATQMQSVIEGMLLLARCEQGAEQASKTSVAVADLVEKCWHPHAETARERNLQVRRTVPQDVALQTNPDLFQSIVANLVSNAVEYTPHGGEVIIESRSENGTFELFVANSVEGLEEADLPRLFERFWRNDSARSGTRHTGLGLSLARACAEILDLEISAKLEASSGRIVFCVTPRTGPTGTNA